MINSHGDGVAVDAQHLSKTYGKTSVVDSLSFSARPGVVTGFLGPNGAGKSTTLRMVLGLVTPTRGRVTIGGQHISRLPHPGLTIGALLDAQAVHPHRTATNHLLAFAQALGHGRLRVAEVLDRVGLVHDASRPVGEFSLGMQQRLGIAADLLGDPAVLVLDEPLNGLDPEGIRWMRTFMRDFAHGGRTVLFSSHLMSEMELTADELIVINRGRLLAAMPLDYFVHTNTASAVRVRADDASALRRALEDAGFAATAADGDAFVVAGVSTRDVGSVTATAGIALRELTCTRDSLEDIFLRLTHTGAAPESSAA